MPQKIRYRQDIDLNFRHLGTDFRKYSRSLVAIFWLEKALSLVKQEIIQSQLYFENMLQKN